MTTSGISPYRRPRIVAGRTRDAARVPDDTAYLALKNDPRDQHAPQHDRHASYATGVATDGRAVNNTAFDSDAFESLGPKTRIREDDVAQRASAYPAVAEGAV